MKNSLKRLLDWIDSHGGPQIVAPLIKKSPQTFYNYRNRGSLPNMEIFEALAREFNDFDANYILTGIKKETSTLQERAELSQQVEELKIKYGLLQDMFVQMAQRGSALSGKD